MTQKPYFWAYTRENSNPKRYMHPNVIAALFIIAKINEWIKKMWYLYTMKYYLVIKKNEVMPFEATWMDLEIITVSEVS